MCHQRTKVSHDIYLSTTENKKSVVVSDFTSPQCFGSTNNYGRYKIYENRGVQCLLNGCKKIITRNLPTNVLSFNQRASFFLCVWISNPFGAYVPLCCISRSITVTHTSSSWTSGQFLAETTIYKTHTPPQWFSNPWLHESGAADLRLRLHRHRDRQCRS